MLRTQRSLVWLFWQQLIRRKSLWIVTTIAGLAVLLNFTISQQMQEMVEDGVRYDIATRRAVGMLDQYAEQARAGAILFVLLVAALVAPPARRDGTTQFVLTLSVSRLRLAVAQFGALTWFVLLGTLIVHVGYCVAAYRLGTLRADEALFSWLLLLLPLVFVAMTSFSLSLTRPALLVYAILLVIPYVLFPVLEGALDEASTSIPEALRLAGGRAIDSLQLLFPYPDSLILWPRLGPPAYPRPPFPAWQWEILNYLAATAFWVVAGLWAYRRHDFGSRTPTK
jgi:hypothetical protein